MEEKKTQKTKRDLYLIVGLFVILGGIFIYFQFFKTQQEASRAHIYYGSTSDPIVTIDFQKQQVTANHVQSVPNQYDNVYPLIDENQHTVTLLGDYEINGVRQIVVITYDFGLRTVQITEEQSPNNICSREGASNGKPLICLPNRVRVEFETNAEFDFIT